MKAILSLAALALFAVEAAAGQQGVFVDRTADLGLDLKNGAACWADLDNDGRVDLCAGGVVWRNKVGKGFTRIADGLGQVVAADFDNDGFADLFSLSSKRVYRSDSGKAFTPMAMPDLPKGSCRGACWGDFNGDGFVDLYVGGYEHWKKGLTYPDVLLLNRRGKGFDLAWTDARHRARGVTACDLDRDGDLDVYVSNYRLQPNVLWLNDGSGVFRDAAVAQNALATSKGFRGGHSIGAAWGDFDNDGWIDLFAGNFAHRDRRGDQPKSRFLRNLRAEGKAAFQERGPCGVFYQESYASPAAGDYDNDGDLDVFFTTVYGTASFGKKNHPVLFRNEGGFRFSDVAAEAGLAKLPPTYQAAWADVDNDGDLDLATAGRLFENQGTGRHWLKIRLRGDGTTVNRSAIGTQVRVKLEDKTLTRQVEAGTGEGNQNALCLHFGLGTRAAPVDLEILWPGGDTTTLRAVEVDRVIEVVYGKRPFEKAADGSPTATSSAAGSVSGRRPKPSGLKSVTNRSGPRNRAIRSPTRR